MCQLNLMIMHLPCQGSKNQRNRRTLTREIDDNSFNSSGTACGRFNWEKRMRRSPRRASPSGLAVLVADAVGFVEFRVRFQLHPKSLSPRRTPVNLLQQQQDQRVLRLSHRIAFYWNDIDPKHIRTSSIEQSGFEVYGHDLEVCNEVVILLRLCRVLGTFFLLGMMIKL
ncbi:hypothetical protein AHAS_Ahas13G0152400 [Arachis hypogaea]